MKYRYGPDGVHLFNRNTGMNMLFDEIKPQQEKWSRAPRQVSIALTNLCDLHCTYCYAPKHRAQLDSQNLRNWLKELDDEGCLGVGLGGGEPTLHPDFPAICQYITNHTELAVTFTTHGHRLDEQLLSSLAGNVHFIRFSVDGVGATYESLRGRSFATLLLKAKMARKIAALGVNVVINSATVVDLDAVATLAAEIDASELLLLPEQPVLGSPGIDAGTAAALLSWVREYQGSVPLRISEAGARDMPICDPLPLETGLRSHAHIDAGGTIKRTSFQKHGVRIGTSGVLQALNDLASIVEIAT